jgi:hypothetical protein
MPLALRGVTEALRGTWAWSLRTLCSIFC